MTPLCYAAPTNGTRHDPEPVHVGTTVCQRCPLDADVFEDAAGTVTVCECGWETVR
jgi:hypothetical protein